MSTAASKTTDYDLIVIGGGAVGENVADYATQQGLQVAIVESELVGGECSYWACMPSKALLRSGNALRAARRLPGTREAVTGELDVRAVLERRTTFTSGWKDDGQAKWVQSAGIELIRGHATVTGAGQVKVDGRMYTARAVALATGSVPHIPEIDGLAEAQPWGTREATSAKTVPQRLIVLGGGVAGTEMAFAFSSLGAHVTVLSRSALLSHEEPFVGECLADALTAEGVDVRIGATPSHIDRDAEGLVTATLEDGSTIQADEILVATGRTPATDGLGLDSLGLGGNEGLAVDDTMLVKGTDWLYAVGDVNGRALLTHQGKYQARAAGEAIAARLNGTQVRISHGAATWQRLHHTAVPHVVFSDPEVASVGKTEAKAREAGLHIKTVEYDLGSIAGSSLQADDYAGRAKLVVDEDRGVIVGATFVGQDVAELLHSATIAIVGEVPIDRLWHAVPSYPTISEVWLRLLETYTSQG